MQALSSTAKTTSPSEADEYHFFTPNAIRRYSVGTKDKDLRVDRDGSLTITSRRTSLPIP